MLTTRRSDCLAGDDAFARTVVLIDLGDAANGRFEFLHASVAAGVVPSMCAITGEFAAAALGRHGAQDFFHLIDGIGEDGVVFQALFRRRKKVPSACRRARA